MPPKIDKTGLSSRGSPTSGTPKLGKTGLSSRGRVGSSYRLAEKMYNISKDSVGKKVTGSTKLNNYSPEKLKRFVSKVGGVLTVAKSLPTAIKVPALLAALTATGYVVGKGFKNWLDARTGKTGKIPKAMLGTSTPKDTGDKGLSAKPNIASKLYKSAKKPTKGQTVPQGNAHGGKVTKAYAKGGGVRKPKTYG